ncbi:MAG: hypothetical protein HC867_07650 [Bacteroidia bacterium]|nr:hypothetical protein [Bacteroidia bacterium]
MPLLQTSLEEYRQVNQEQNNSNNPLFNEYSNIMYRTGWVHEQLGQKEKALEYYRKTKSSARILHRLLLKLTSLPKM